MRNLVSPFFWIRSCFVFGVLYFLYYFFFGGTSNYEKKFEKFEVTKVEEVLQKPRIEADISAKKLEIPTESTTSDFGIDFKTVNSNLICSGENEKKCAAPLKRHRSIIYVSNLIWT